jgi:DNA-binding CsgD family transcriptional regulator
MNLPAFMDLPEISLNKAENLVDLINTSGHIKEIKTGKYVFSNITNLELFGLNLPSEIVGLTLKDMDSFMNRFWGNNAKEVENFDNQIKVTGKNIFDTNRVWLTRNRKIFRHKMFKYPVKDNSGNISYILTISEKDNSYINHHQKYWLCKKFYSSNDFIIRILDELGIMNHFDLRDLPTEFEIINILYKSSHYTNKEIAYIRKVSIKTVEKQLSSFRSKILAGNTLEQVIRIIIGVEDV